MQKTISFAMAGFLIFGVAVTLSSRIVPNTDTAGLKSYYGFIIDRVITECRQRGRLRNGRSERASALNCFKATFFKLRSDHLIVELVDKKIGKSELLTRYQLNKSFYRHPGAAPPPL